MTEEGGVVFCPCPKRPRCLLRTVDEKERGRRRSVSRKIWLFAFCFGLLGLLLGGLVTGIRDRAAGIGAVHYVPPLKVVGDVAGIILRDLPRY